MSALDTLADEPPWWCKHPRTSSPRARRDAHGSIRHRRQCLDCGEAVGNQLSRADAERENRGPSQPFDEALLQQGRRREALARQAREAAHKAKRSAWWRWYNQYLQPPDWRRRRDKVLRRAAGFCEGCLTHRAIHVHHKTYEHVGRELLYELVALCEDCHEIAHAKNPNEVPVELRYGGEVEE